MHKISKQGFDTRAIHAGEEPKFGDGQSGAVVQAIELSTTYARQMVEVPTNGFEYSRSGNPTRFALEEKLASIEQGKYGFAFASGLAAESTLIIALLKSGDHILASDDLYGGTVRIFNKVVHKLGISASYANATHIEQFAKAITPQTKLIWIETPSNPLLKIVDIEAVARLAKSAGLWLVVDNTFMSPALQNPLLLGADLVVHSVTKYIGGHSDVVGGAIVTNNAEIAESIRFFQNAMGAVPSPFDCYLTMRGIKTLGLRMKKHSENAMAVAKYLSGHKLVEKVFYPGLESHIGNSIVSRQCKDFGGMLSFELKGGYSVAKQFLESLRMIALAESLGGVESLIEHPASMTHASVPAEQRKLIGLSDGLIRMSVGVEDIEDIISDIEAALL